MAVEPTFIDSPMLGRSRVPSEDELKTLAALAQEMPLALFQTLNRAFNERGLCIAIAQLPPEQRH